MKPKILEFAIFKCKVAYFIGWTKTNFENYLTNNFGFQKELSSYDGATILCENDTNTLICIWIKDKNNIEHLAHESLHAANMILNFIGHEPSFTNDELQAYLLGYIVSNARKV